MESDKGDADSDGEPEVTSSVNALPKGWDASKIVFLEWDVSLFQSVILDNT